MRDREDNHNQNALHKKSIINKRKTYYFEKPKEY